MISSVPSSSTDSCVSMFGNYKSWMISNLLTVLCLRAGRLTSIDYLEIGLGVQLL